MKFDRITVKQNEELIAERRGNEFLSLNLHVLFCIVLKCDIIFLDINCSLRFKLHHEIETVVRTSKKFK